MGTETKVVPAFLGGFICIYGLVSGFVKERLYLSESLVAMVFGIVIGPQVINVVDPRDFVNIEKFTLEFARYVIAIQVMAAGIMLPRRYIVRKWRTMSVLLGPVMIVMWLVTAGIIRLMFDLSFKQALLIASCAAPTDPILANSVVKGRYAESHVPKNVRDAISAESGVNDGLGLPFLFFALYLLNESYSTGHAMGKWFYWIWCYNILLSIAIGIIVGYVARKLLRLSESYDLIDKESFLAFSIGLAVFLVGILQLIRSDDVLCCFVAGHSFTWDDWFREETKDAHFQEVLDGLINVSFFVYFGTIIPWAQFRNADLVIEPWRLIVCAIMVLFLRRLPIVVLLTKITPAFRNYRQSIFAGWFGPIGVGALFFAEIVLEEIEHEPDHFHIRSREIIQPIVMFLVFSSVLVHGITLPLVFIGKVVRSRSRSISSMSIRNGVLSRLSFASSREPTGIHGIHLPTVDSTMDMSDEYIIEDSGEKNDSSKGASGVNSIMNSSANTVDGQPTARTTAANKRLTLRDNNGDGPAAPLELSRTITIDEVPRVDRKEMDIHYRIAKTFQQYKQHFLQQPVTGISAPDVKEAATGRETPPPVRIQSAIDVKRASSEYPGIERIRAHKHQYLAGPDTGRDAEGATGSTSKAPLKAGRGKEAEEEHTAGDETPGSSSGSSSDHALMLAADKHAASKQPSHQVAKTATVTSDIEAPKPALIRDSSLGEVVSRRHSLPKQTSRESIPSVQAAQHEVAIDIDNQHDQHQHQHQHQHSTNRAHAAKRVRRTVHRRRSSNEEEELMQACQFIGNHLNPLGRLEDGEVVDYDDPEGEAAEESFTDNNIDDRIADYLNLNIGLGSSIRRLRSRLPSATHKPEP